MSSKVPSSCSETFGEGSGDVRGGAAMGFVAALSKLFALSVTEGAVRTGASGEKRIRFPVRPSFCCPCTAALAGASETDRLQ